jgi:hypothetical protein
MKKLGFLSAFILTIFIANATVFFFFYELPSVQLLLSLAVGHASNKDMTNFVEYFSKGEVIPELQGLSNGYTNFSENSHKKANLPVGFDLDFRFFFGNIGAGFQIGYHLDKAEYELSASGSSSYSPVKATTAVELWVVPYVGTLFYRVDLGSSNSFVLLGGGLGYYSGKLKVDQKLEGTTSSDYAYDDSYRQSKIGFHVLVEYDYAFDFGLTLFAGLKYRYVKFDEFKDGSYVMTNYDGSKLKASLTGVVFYFGTGFSF